MTDIDKLLGYHASPQLRKRLEKEFKRVELEAQTQAAVSIRGFIATFTDMNKGLSISVCDTYIESNEKELEQL